MPNPGGRTIASATTTPLLAPTTPKTPSDSPPRLASAQGYVGHAAFWIDVLGLMAHSKRRDVRTQLLSEIAEINKADSAASSAVKTALWTPAS